MPGSSLNSIPYLRTFSKGLINVFELIKLRGGPLMMPGSSLNSIPYLCTFPGSMHTGHSRFKFKTAFIIVFAESRIMLCGSSPPIRISLNNLINFGQNL